MGFLLFVPLHVPAKMNGTELTEFMTSRLQAGVMTKMFDLAGAVIFIYDYLLTLGMEVEYVWPGPWTTIKVVYFIQRYIPFIDTMWIALYINFGENLSPGLCQRLNTAGRALMCVGLTTSEIILTFRVWAVWNRPKVLTIGLPILFVGCFLPPVPILFVFLSSVKFITLPHPSVGCVPIAGSSLIIVDWALLLLWDSFVLALMAIPAFRSFRFRSNSALYHAVYAEGVIYYFYLFIISIVNILLFGLPSVDGSYQFLATTLSRCLHSILTSRVLLHIRAGINEGQSEEFEQISIGDVTHRKALRGMKPPVGEKV
ncbi:unnamed protein product [Cyclocybe aegerita]|uniref:DUF6533 domain-containing protein n=1 Tax=Cyclocybe aegerita TaxID=1973307 RepID=A0A8S0VSU9_CYCAE|nr:unnamed protein product [Cyclocybe aegerita]